MRTLHKIRQIVVMEPEDVKAALRKQFGSMENFAGQAGVSSQQVRDLLRGKSAAAHSLVATTLGFEPDLFVIERPQARRKVGARA